MRIIMERDVWMNSQLSIARYYGGATINGEQYQILPPEGDLVNAKYAKLYRELGREKLQEYINRGLTLKEIKADIKRVKDEQGKEYENQN